jgi:hypothetical protein
MGDSRPGTTSRSTEAGDCARRAVTAVVVPALVCWALAAGMAMAQQPPPNALPPQALQQIAAVWAEKTARVGEQRKLASGLLFARRQRQGLPAAAGVLRLPALDIDDRDRVLVDIDADVTPALLQAITLTGGDIIAAVPRFAAARARVPFQALELLAGRPDVRRIRPAEQPIVRKINTSQGDVAHRASTARATFGPTGAGVAVGVLSDGATTLAQRQATGDLPPVVTVLAGQAGSGDEGTAMLEIVHDLAPGSPLLFATASGGEAQFAANIIDLCNAGAKVLVDDVGYPSEPVFEDGMVAQAVNTVTASGCHFVSAAGNHGNLSNGTASVW